MQLTKNFNLKEFACHDGKSVPLELLANVKDLAEQLQVLRDETDTITITSGYRSPEHNKKIGGAKFSEHVNARAADIKVKGKTPIEVKAIIERLISEGKMKNGGIGLYDTWVHYDTGKIRRWKN